MNDPAWLILAVALVLIVVVPLFVGKSDRRRIQEQIGSRGGQIISIERSVRSGGRSSRIYDVSYLTPSGESLKASCRTGMGGVYWLSSTPPGFPS